MPLHRHLRDFWLFGGHIQTVDDVTAFVYLDATSHVRPGSRATSGRHISMSEVLQKKLRDEVVELRGRPAGRLHF